jgi:hypothetical protein
MQLKINDYFDAAGASLDSPTHFWLAIADDYLSKITRDTKPQELGPSDTSLRETAETRTTNAPKPNHPDKKLPDQDTRGKRLHWKRDTEACSSPHNNRCVYIYPIFVMRSVFGFSNRLKSTCKWKLAISCDEHGFLCIAPQDVVNIPDTCHHLMRHCKQLAGVCCSSMIKKH